jgi:hypothetical protein
MSPSGLRREGARGRLVIERIAGKDYTTLANIERMRELCRVQAKGPRLYLRRARPSIGPKAVWLIRDGRRDFATGCVGSPAEQGPPEGAQQALADYIDNKYRPTRKARDIEQIDIADVLSIYLDDCGDDQADRKKFEGRISRLNSFWGGRMLSDVSTATCREYVKVRGNTGGARRDLEDLRAAIGHHATENLHRAIVNVWLPPRGAPRDRWLTRSEVARLLWACWRHREIQTRHRGSDRGRRLPTDKRPLRHLARFILIGVYTGTRASAIAAASPQRAAGRSFVDLDQGIFYRLAQGKSECPPSPKWNAPSSKRFRRRSSARLTATTAVPPLTLDHKHTVIPFRLPLPAFPPAAREKSPQAGLLARRRHRAREYARRCHPRGNPDRWRLTQD